MTPLRVLLAVPVVLLATAVVALCWPAPSGPAPVASSSAVEPVVAPAVDPAVEVLRAWDARRAAAWAAGDPRALAALYAAGSRTGRHDRAMLAAYAGHRLRVTGLRMQLLAVDVVVSAPDRLVLDVTDRLVRAVARRGDRAVRLPTDQPTAHRIELRRVTGQWRVVEVRAQPSP